MHAAAVGWFAQLHDGTKQSGGLIQTLSTNVSAVPLDQLCVFSIVDTAVTYTYYQPWNAWYKNGQPVEFVYPSSWVLADGTLLTVDREEGNQLALLQT